MPALIPQLEVCFDHTLVITLYDHQDPYHTYTGDQLLSRAAAFYFLLRNSLRHTYICGSLRSDYRLCIAHVCLPDSQIQGFLEHIAPIVLFCFDRPGDHYVEEILYNSDF